MVAPPLERTKIVVRRLPPSLPEADFKQAVDEHFDGQYNWFAYVPGRTSVRKTKHSRAYLNFLDPLRVYDFRGKFDGHTFVSERGAQFSCTVEFAPYQRVPKKSKRKDPKEGTLDKDPEYQDFLQQLDEEPSTLPSAELQDLQPPARPQDKHVTSLMQYLQDKWTGKLVAQNSSKVRQKKPKRQEAAFDAPLPPPPGFDPLPSSHSKPPRGAQRIEPAPSNGKARLEAAQEAVAAALEGVDLDPASTPATEQQGKQRPPQKKRPSAKVKGADKKGPRKPSGEAPPPTSEAPKQILRNPAAVAAAIEPAAEAAPKPDQVTLRAFDGGGAHNLPQKPVRVRAGYQVYTPKLRTEGEAPRAAPTPNAPSQTAERGGRAHLDAGRALDGGASSAAPKKDRQASKRREARHKERPAESNGWAEARKTKTEGSEAGGWDAAVSHEDAGWIGVAPSPASAFENRDASPGQRHLLIAGDAWANTPSVGAEWVLPDPDTHESGPSEIGGGAPGTSHGGRAPRGRRRNWRATSEPSPSG